MSDQEPFAEDVSEAIRSRGAPADAVALVENAFTWRTINQELLALSFDSANDLAGVRDPDALRSLEFSDDLSSVVVEISPTGSLQGQVTMPASSESVAVVLRSLTEEQTTQVDQFGGFSFETISSGPLQLQIGDVQTVSFTAS